MKNSFFHSHVLYLALFKAIYVLLNNRSVPTVAGIYNLTLTKKPVKLVKQDNMEKQGYIPSKVT